MNDGLPSLTINTLRMLSVDMIQKANSGHPGLPMGCAPMAYVLWQNHLKVDPEHPLWPDRDRFVLSGGHGSALLYSLLHLYGYGLKMSDLKDFRQWDSLTPGHPEFDLTPGVEATTGPLGQGMCNAIGMAMAEKSMAHRFNRDGHTVVDHLTYALVTDGDLMEGVTAEASSLAGHLKLGKLICLYDANDVTLDGPADLAYTEDFAARYESYGWQVLLVKDGDTDLDSLDAAIEAAKKDQSRPSMIVIKTTIGYGAPNKQGTCSAHGSPLGDSERTLARKALGWPFEEDFSVPDGVASHCVGGMARGVKSHNDWTNTFKAWAAAYPELAAEWHGWMTGDLPDGWGDVVPVFETGDDMATRVASGKTMNALADTMPWLIGGDADLSGSTKTTLKGHGSFDGATGAGRNIHFGVREHAMGSIANGMAYHGGVRPFTATFLVFSDYMRPAVRLAAMNDLPVVYVWTHDSVALGEDGPTHQPVEQVMSLRMIPGLTVMRPADANETAEAWRWTAQHTEGPVALCLSRQSLPTVDRSSHGSVDGLSKGAYILAAAEGGSAKAVLIATGSEVSAALEARDLLQADGIPTRVVSMPCWSLFEAQSHDYQSDVLDADGALMVSIEAGVTLGWQKWVGTRGLTFGIDRFGASAPSKVNLSKFGFSGEAIASSVKATLESR